MSDDVQTGTDQPKKRRAYVAFEGGGAKGVAHIGAYAKIREVYDYRGFAGTSAGSLMAALAACGFSPDEIFDRASKKSIIGKVKGAKNALDLFDPWSKRKLKFGLGLYRYLGSRDKIKGIMPYALCAAATAFLLSSILFGVLWSIFVVFISVLSVPGALLLLAFGLKGCSEFGIASLDEFERHLRRILAAKVLDDDNGCVLFCHFGPMAGRPTLKMVATNLKTGKIELFSPETTPLVPVSAAVAASICIPFVFKPRKIEVPGEGGADGVFFDGGLLSNQPAWTFDDERRIDAEAATILVGISEHGSKEPSTVLEWVSRFISTAIFGASDLNQRNLGHAVDISVVPKGIGTLDLDVSPELISRAIEVSESDAGLVIQKDFNFDAFAQDSLDLFKSYAQLEFLGQKDVDSIHFRASVADVSASARKWRRSQINVGGRSNPSGFDLPEAPIVFRAQVGFDGHSDKWLPISPRSVCGLVVSRMLDSREDEFAAFVDLPKSGEESIFLSEPQDEMARTLVSKSTDWIFACCIKVSSDGPLGERLINGLGFAEMAV